MPVKKVFLLFSLPVLLSLFMHLGIFSLDVRGFHVWRQSQTQTVIYTYTFETQDILNPLRFDIHDGGRTVLYEFPLYQYTVAGINRLLGYSVCHTRVFSYLIFVLLLTGFYRWSRHFLVERQALVLNALLCFSPLLYYYCVNSLPDITGLAAAAWALYFYERFRTKKRIVHLHGFFFLLAVATLIKLPFVLFAVVLLPELLPGKRISIMPYVLACLYLLLPLAWYQRAIPTWEGNGITSGVLGRDFTLSSWLENFVFTMVSSFPELLCNYAALPLLITGAVLTVRKKYWRASVARPYLLLVIALMLYLLFELNILGKTHDYYLLPFLVPLFLLIAAGIRRFSTVRMKPWLWVFVLAAPVLAFLRIQHRWSDKEIGYNRAYSDEAHVVQTLVPKNELLVVEGDESRYIALYFFKRAGFSVQKGEPDRIRLEQLQQQGAAYFVTPFAAAELPVGSILLWNGQLKIYKIQ